jgi:glycosyltransferase involved in cell wall biosynthesis
MRYKLDRQWFHIPNQFWAHKNHAVVLEALHILKTQGNCPLVIATGATRDNRNANYFPLLMTRISDYGLQEDFRVLGVLPYEDVLALMRDSVAIINPSLFEGWSTSVEESKALGKQIVLSDLPVHREQEPARGLYFDARDPRSLAKLLLLALKQYDQTEDEIHQERARQQRMPRAIGFAKQYESIVLEICCGLSI